jgi:hypothetical protein
MPNTKYPMVYTVKSFDSVMVVVVVVLVVIIWRK